MTLGYLFDFGHLSRALCCRLKGSGEAPLLPEEQLPAGYRLNHPELGKAEGRSKEQGYGKESEGIGIAFENILKDIQMY